MTTHATSTMSTYAGPSMIPTLRPGDGLLIEPYGHGQDIAPGDIVAHPHPEKGFDVVHRVIAVDAQGQLLTQGDNNPLADPYRLAPAAVLGRVAAARRGARTVPLAGGADGLRQHRRAQVRRRLRLAVATCLRPAYNLLADSGLCRGMLLLDAVPFARPEGTEWQLMRQARGVGRCRPGGTWEIDFPWRLFVDAASLPPHAPPAPAMPMPSRREKAAMAFFLVVCAYLVYPFPQVTLIPGERADLMAGLLCALAAGAALLARRHDLTRLLPRPERWLLGLLAAAGLASGLLADGQPSSLCRSTVLLATGLGGYLSGRILLSRMRFRMRFRFLCVALLTATLALAAAGFAVHGFVNAFLESRLTLFPVRAWIPDAFQLSTRLHHWLDLLLLLGIVPLGMAISGRAREAWAGATLLLAGYGMMLLSRTRSAIILATAAVGIAMTLRPYFLRRFALPLALVLTTGTAAFVIGFPDRILQLDPSHPSLAYRAEAYPFAAHILRQHPWTGIGLRTPRRGFLCDYRTHYPFHRDGWFAYGVEHWVTSENIFLTLAVGMGLPFALLTVLVLALAGRRLWQNRPAAHDPAGFSPAAILVMLAACLLHALAYDSLLFPPVCWFTGIALALFPATPSRPSSCVTAPSTP